MKKYEVSYTLQGQLEIEATNEEEAIDFLKGFKVQKNGHLIDDEDLFSGIEGFDRDGVEELSIEADAITVQSIKELGVDEIA